MTMLITAAIAVLALSAASAPPEGIPRGDAVHPPTHDVLGWTVSDDRTLYVEDRSGQWYRVDLVSVCDGLRTAFGLELQGNPLFDQSSSLFTGDQSCPIASVSRVSEPAIPPREPLAPAAGPSGH
jgi:hypothetical protein